MYHLGRHSVMHEIQVKHFRYFPFVLHVKISLGLEMQGWLGSPRRVLGLRIHLTFCSINLSVVLLLLFFWLQPVVARLLLLLWHGVLIAGKKGKSTGLKS